MGVEADKDQPIVLLVPEAGLHVAREPNLFRFGLRQLMFFVAGICMLLALLVATSGAWPLIILFFTALVAAHVVGTYLGTRLRDTSRDVRQWRATHAPAVPDHPIATLQPVDWSGVSLPARTTLSDYRAANRWSWCVMGGMALVGGALGLAGIRHLVGPHATWPGMAVGSLSCGVMAGWLGWAATNFWSITRHAWKQANSVDRIASTRRRPKQ